MNVCVRVCVCSVFLRTSLSVSLYCFSVCMCLFVCVSVCLCVHVLACNTEDNLGFKSLSLSCMKWSHFVARYTRLADPWAPEDSPVSTSHLTTGAVELQICAAMSSFAWFLGIWSEADTVALKTLDPLSCPYPRLSLLFYLFLFLALWFIIYWKIFSCDIFWLYSDHLP